MSGTETKSEPISIGGGIKIITGSGTAIPEEPDRLIIELRNLGEGHLRTVKRELKVLIEDYGWQKMIRGSIKITEEK